MPLILLKIENDQKSVTHLLEIRREDLANGPKIEQKILEKFRKIRLNAIRQELLLRPNLREVDDKIKTALKAVLESHVGVQALVEESDNEVEVTIRFKRSNAKWLNQTC